MNKTNYEQETFSKDFEINVLGACAFYLIFNTELPWIYLDNNWIQCQYDWRYSVYEGGFYYWLYEEITVNVISTSTLNENVFLNANPAIVFTK